jgi:hypothetical protein
MSDGSILKALHWDAPDAPYWAQALYHTFAGSKLPNEDPTNYMLKTLLQQVTGLPDGDRLRKFVTFMHNAHPKLSSMLQDSISKSSSEKADLIASLTVSRSAMIGENYKLFLQQSRDDVFNDDSMRDIRVSNRLRMRYYLPGDEVGRESKEQIASDKIQTQLFQHTIPNADAGGNNNSVYLDGKRNDHMRFSGELGNPRPPNNEDQLILPFQTLPQYESDQPLRSIMQDRLVKKMSEYHIIKELGHRSYVLNDDVNNNILQDAIQLPGAFTSQSQDVQPLSLELKSSLASWRGDDDIIISGIDKSYDENHNPMYTL